MQDMKSIAEREDHKNLKSPNALMIVYHTLLSPTFGANFLMQGPLFIWKHCSVLSMVMIKI